MQSTPTDIFRPRPSINGDVVRISFTSEDVKAVLRMLGGRSFVFICTALLALLTATKINGRPGLCYPCA